MTRRILVIALFAAAVPALAQQQPIAHEPLSCVRAGEHGVVFGVSDAKGEARLYYRRAGALEWCYVDGVRTLDRIRAILPKFENGIEVEHFFVTVDDGEVTARSPRIFEVKIANECATLIARNVEFMLNTCENDAGQLGSAVAAGYALQGNEDPEPVSNFQPE